MIRSISEDYRHSLNGQVAGIFTKCMGTESFAKYFHRILRMPGPGFGFRLDSDEKATISGTKKGRFSSENRPFSNQLEQLDEPSVVDRHEILEDLFDVLLARTRADQQCIRRINHDIVMQRIHHDDLLAGRLDQAVSRVIEL